MKDVALYFAIQDKTIRRVYPNLQYRKDAFLELADGDKTKAKEMLESDLAFNWHDKEGGTLLSRIAESFKMDKDEREIIANLKTVHPILLDSYLPLESKDDGCTVTNENENEEKDAKRHFFTTKFEKRYTIYQDLYEEFEKDINGFYTDEPNILDFLNWLVPEHSLSSK